LKTPGWQSGSLKTWPRVRAQAVLGRVGQPDDIAVKLVAFVPSTSVTRQTIVIDGGMPGAMR